MRQRLRLHHNPAGCLLRHDLLDDADGRAVRHVDGSRHHPSGLGAGTGRDRGSLRRSRRPTAVLPPVDVRRARRPQPAGRPQRPVLRHPGRRRPVGHHGLRRPERVAFGSDSAHHITLRNLEVFDNGVPTTISNGYNSDGENITLRGNHLTFDRLLVHDGGQDDFQDQTHAAGTLHDLTFQNSWIYFARENPQHPGYSFNEPQSTGCTHADGIQIYSGGQQSAITVDHMVFGPGGNQGFYPGDSGTGAKFDNVSITNTLFLASASHNVITDLAVSGWTMDHNTIYAPQGGSEMPANGPMRLTNTIKFGGYWNAPGGTWTASGNVSYGGTRSPEARRPTRVSWDPCRRRSRLASRSCGRGTSRPPARPAPRPAPRCTRPGTS